MMIAEESVITSSIENKMLSMFGMADFILVSGETRKVQEISSLESKKLSSKCRERERLF